MLIRRDDISFNLNGKSLIEGFNELGDTLNKKQLNKYIKLYIKMVGINNFNRFLRKFAKNAIINHLSVHISLQMSYYLYNMIWDKYSDMELFCLVYNKVMSERVIYKFKSIIKRLGKSHVYIYQFDSEEGVERYIKVFESMYVSDYLLKYIVSPYIVYKRIRNRGMNFEDSRLEIHRYLNQVYNFTRKM